jgi:hypothetical protein
MFKWRYAILGWLVLRLARIYGKRRMRRLASR